MDLTLGFVTDIHFGPEARFEGKLRKLSAHAPELLERFVAKMNHEVRPDAIAIIFGLVLWAILTIEI